ncbi:MAG: 2-haloacid dehalogenase [Gammaproteobacteria bacterium]|jgi:2-haloacid dehalogenase
MNSNHIKVLAFDVFGTVVDWHGSVSREIETLIPGIGGDKFALAWRAGYMPAMQAVMNNNEWIILDDLHRRILNPVLEQFGIKHLDESQKQVLNQVWHRLDPWPDSISGLTRLKQNFIICTLSNGNIGLLTDIAKRAGLPWDCILSAENFRRYKPDPATYLGVAEIFNCHPKEVMLVAAHHEDLRAAENLGLHTAYIERPLEFGKNHIKDVSAIDQNDWHAVDFNHLADQLGC